MYIVYTVYFHRFNVHHNFLIVIVQIDPSYISEQNPPLKNHSHIWHYNFSYIFDVYFNSNSDLEYLEGFHPWSTTGWSTCEEWRCTQGGLPQFWTTVFLKLNYRRLEVGWIFLNFFCLMFNKSLFVFLSAFLWYTFIFNSKNKHRNYLQSPEGKIQKALFTNRDK